MGVYIADNKLVIIREPKSICLNLTKKVDDSIKHEIDSVINAMGFQNQTKNKNETDKLLSKYKHGNHIHEHWKQ